MRELAGRRVLTRWQQRPRLGAVLQVRAQSLVDHAPLQLRVQHRERHLDAPKQVAPHPVGARQVDELAAAGGVVVDPVVLQKAADHRSHLDVVRKPFNPRPQRAGASHDQVDPHAGAGGLVQRVDGRLVDQRVDLGDYARRLAGAGQACFVGDRGQIALVQRERRQPQVPEPFHPRQARQVHEDLFDVRADPRVRGQHPEIRIQLGRSRVVVARAQVCVPDQALPPAR